MLTTYMQKHPNQNFKINTKYDTFSDKVKNLELINLIKDIFIKQDINLKITHEPRKLFV